MDQTDSIRQELVDAFVETAGAHHRAFAATDGEDPDWPIWYAGHLRQTLSRLLGTELSQSTLVRCLMDAESERIARDQDAEWAPFYADHILEHFAPARTPVQDTLALYQFDSCPFCRIVRRVIERLELDVEMRDIHGDPQHWDDLVAARGRGTVPVLRVVSPDGTERWMPESADIVRYLDATYG